MPPARSPYFEAGAAGDAGTVTRGYCPPIPRADLSETVLDPIAAEPRRQDGFQICLRPRAGEIEVRLGERVNQRANDVGPTNGDAARRPDVSAEPIQKDDLPIEQHDRDLGPLFGVRGPTPAFLGTIAITAFGEWDEDVVAALAQPFPCACGSIQHARHGELF